MVAQPQTYMNRSGWAVECLVDALDVAPDRLLVVFDDTTLPLGTLRLRPRGGPGGHRGLESVLASLRRDELPRLRLGIAPSGESALAGDLSEFVLGPFAADEAAPVDAMLARAAEAVDAWRHEGIEAAMNRFNG